MFSIKQIKENTLTFKIKAAIEELKIESMKKEMQENKNKYSAEELKIFDKLLKEAIKDYDKYSETYSKATIMLKIEELRQKNYNA